MRFIIVLFFVYFLPGTGVRRGVKAVKTMIEKTVKCPSGEEEKVLVVVVQMTEDSAVALMMNEVRAEEVTMTVDPDEALMMTVGPGGALTMTEVTEELMTTADQGVEWTMTMAQEEALMTTVDPVEAWMNLEGLDVGQMMTGAPEEEGMMRGEAAGVWMTLAHVVEMTLDPGNLLRDQVQAHVVFLFLFSQRACCQMCFKGFIS